MDGPTAARRLSCMCRADYGWRGLEDFLVVGLEECMLRVYSGYAQGMLRVRSQTDSNPAENVTRLAAAYSHTDDSMGDIVVA